MGHDRIANNHFNSFSCTYQNMKLYLFFSTLCILECFINCTQTRYQFIPDHCEITNVNESLIHYDIKKCYKLSRTELYLNASFYFKNDILTDDMGQVMITGYMFRSNEYRKGPIEFMLGFCSAMTSKDFDIPHMLSISNMRCPFKKGTNYYVYKMSPNATNMPPLIPEGRWMLQLDFMYMNKYVMASLKWYSGVDYPIRFT